VIFVDSGLNVLDGDFGPLTCREEIALHDIASTATKTDVANLVWQGILSSVNGQCPLVMNGFLQHAFRHRTIGTLFLLLIQPLNKFQSAHLYFDSPSIRLVHKLTPFGGLAFVFLKSLTILSQAIVA
jgi:hypothetical protein